MSTFTINFSNYTPDTTIVTVENPSVAGSATKGINIYKQQFKTEDAKLELDLTNDIIPALEKVVTGKISVESSTGDKLSADIYVAAGPSNKTNTFKLKPNSGIIFKVQQGSSSNKYYAYYTYFKDNVETNGNFWIIYMTSKDRAPLVFDSQDGRELTVTKAVAELDETTGAPKVFGRILSVDTTNFVLNAANDENGYSEDNIELKNTSFNLAVDEKQENNVKVTPLAAFTVASA